MSKRAGLLTQTQRKRLAHKGGRGCLLQLLLLPLELLVALLQGFGKAAKRQSRYKWPRGYQ